MFMMFQSLLLTATSLKESEVDEFWSGLLDGTSCTTEQTGNGSVLEAD